MRYDRNLMIANAIVVVALFFSLARLLIWTGSFHWNVACGFLPTALAAIALRPGARRSIGGIAIVFNGFLVIAGAFALLFSAMSVERLDVWGNVLGFAFGAALVLTGSLNARVIWRTFPPKRSGGP